MVIQAASNVAPSHSCNISIGIYQTAGAAPVNINFKDVASGAFFCAVGILYGYMTFVSLPVGEALNMGPGYFPIVLSGMLVILGASILGRGLIARIEPHLLEKVPWRAVVMLSLATIIFAMWAEKLGMLFGVFILSFVATWASPKIKPVMGALTSLGIALFCTALFSYGIRLPIPVFGEWFSR